MNDLLKSMLVQIEGEGTLQGFSYEPEELGEQPTVSLPPLDAFAHLGREMVGCRIELQTGQSTVVGRLIGRQLGNPDQFALLDDDLNVQLIPLPEIERMLIIDRTAFGDLTYYLDNLVSSSRQSSKSMTMFLGEGNHDLTLSYITEMAPWRTTYRLFLTESSARIQCWGLVDNTLDEDLDEINLTLVSGKPVSFVYDLYLQQWLQRQRSTGLLPHSLTEAGFLHRQVDFLRRPRSVPVLASTQVHFLGELRQRDSARSLPYCKRVLSPR